MSVRKEKVVPSGVFDVKTHLTTTIQQDDDFHTDDIGFGGRAKHRVCGGFGFGDGDV